MSPIPSRLVCFLSLLAVSSASCLAADHYLLPAGAGTKDGSSWENASAGTKESFQSAWNSLSPGDTLRVGSGTYEEIRIVANRGGEAGKPVRLVGVDTGSGLPQLTSNFNKTAPDKSGAVFFEAKLGATAFEIEGFRIKGYRTAVFMRGRHANVKIAKLAVEEAREGIRSEGGGTLENPEAGTHGVEVTDCRFVNFTKRGIRIQGGNYDWKISRCHADAGGKDWATEPFQMCYQVADKSQKNSSVEHHIEFTDCTALNAYHQAPDGKSYWNADGFCVEGGVKNMRYVRCVSMHHTDGGWDDKSEGPEFESCVALDNKRNFRLWGKNIPAKMNNVLSAWAFKRGGSGGQDGLWLLGSINATNCTFLDNSTQIATEEGKNDPAAKLIFENCIFQGGKLPSGDHVKLTDCLVVTENEAGSTGIQARKGMAWAAGSREFDSSDTTKGFSSSRWSK